MEKGLRGLILLASTINFFVKFIFTITIWIVKIKIGKAQFESLNPDN